MGFGVKLLCWMVHYVFRMVHDGTQGEASDALRIRYAPLHRRNPNLIPVGYGFGFLYFVKKAENMQG